MSFPLPPQPPSCIPLGECCPRLLLYEEATKMDWDYLIDLCDLSFLRSINLLPLPARWDWLRKTCISESYSNLFQGWNIGDCVELARSIYQWSLQRQFYFPECNGPNLVDSQIVLPGPNDIVFVESLYTEFMIPINRLHFTITDVLSVFSSMKFVDGYFLYVGGLGMTNALTTQLAQEVYDALIPCCNAWTLNTGWNQVTLDLYNCGFYEAASIMESIHSCMPKSFFSQNEITPVCSDYVKFPTRCLDCSICKNSPPWDDPCSSSTPLANLP